MHISDFFGLIQTIFKSKSAVLPSPVEKAKISYGNHKKLAREISSGCQGNILNVGMDSAKVSFSSTQNAVHLVCVSGGVSVAGSEHITIDNIYETPVNASLARCVGTRPTKRVREQQMPCYQQQNIYIYIVSSHRTVNVRIGLRYVNVNSLDI